MHEADLDGGRQIPMQVTWRSSLPPPVKRMPHMGDAGDYSSTMHYLKAVEAAGTDDAKAVMAKMRELYVYEVKKPSESKGEWDYYKLRAVIPGDEAFRSLKESTCPLVKNG
jgi:branched-chain amino acid transport system substrate-binding protein